MIQDTIDLIRDAVGVNQERLDVWQMALRALITYVAALAMVRIGDKRFIGKDSAFDLVLGFILGSVVSRAITGNAPLLPVLTTGFLLVILHWLFAKLSFHSDLIGSMIKGQPRQLIQGGQIRWDSMRRSHITEKDLLAALRTKGQQPDPRKVDQAYLERHGEISVVPGAKPSVIDITVENGVQTVRLKLE